jgi:hypothetical protein
MDRPAQRGGVRGARKKRHLGGAGRWQVSRRLPPEGTCSCGCGPAQVVAPMTGSTHPTVPQDFSIQVAENEGMPPGPNSKASLIPVARTRRLTGTLTLELSKTPAGNRRNLVRQGASGDETSPSEADRENGSNSWCDRVLGLPSSCAGWHGPDARERSAAQLWQRAGSAISVTGWKATNASRLISPSMPIQPDAPTGRGGSAIVDMRKWAGRPAIPSRCLPTPSCGLPATIGNANAGTGKNATDVCPSSCQTTPISSTTPQAPVGHASVVSRPVPTPASRLPCRRMHI